MPRSPVIVLLALLVLGCPPAQAEDEVVEWVVASNGFPGTRAGSAPTTQVLAASESRLRILDPAQARAIFLSLSDQSWLELYPLARRFRSHDLREFGARRERAEQSQQRQIAQLQRRRARLVDRDDRAALRELDLDVARAGLRLDGQPDRVRLERFPQDRRTGELIVDGETRQVQLDHFQIRVNQAARPVFELWTTRDVSLPVDLLAYYRGLGVLTPEVLARLEEVPGVVVEVRVHLKQGVLAQDSTLQVQQIRSAPPLTPADLTPRLDPNWTEDRDPDDGPKNGGATCAWCGEEVGPNPLMFKARPFCSGEHRQRYIQR